MLSLHTGSKWQGLEIVPHESPLDCLFLPEDAHELTALADFSALRQLGLDLAVPPTKEEWQAVEHLEKLRILSLNCAELTSLAATGILLQGVETVFLMAHRERPDLGSVGAGVIPPTVLRRPAERNQARFAVRRCGRPAAVYTYVPGKAELLDLILDSVYLEGVAGSVRGARHARTGRTRPGRAARRTGPSTMDPPVRDRTAGPPAPVAARTARQGVRR